MEARSLFYREEDVLSTHSTLKSIVSCQSRGRVEAVNGEEMNTNGRYIPDVENPIAAGS